MHGFSISLPKSHLTPTTRILHLGAELNSVLGQVFLSPERLTSIREMLQQVQSQRSVLILLLPITGKDVSCFAIMPWARLHSCSPAMVFAAFPVVGTQQCLNQSGVASPCPPLPHVVGVVGPSERLNVSGAQSSRAGFGCKSTGLECSSSGPGCSRTVVLGGKNEQHQLAGAEGCLSGSLAFSGHC